MGNSSSHKRTNAPKQPPKERPPDMDKAQGQQFFSHVKQKKLNAKIVLLFPVDKWQQRTEVAGLGVWAQRPYEDVTGVQAGIPASRMLQGAGDARDQREQAHRYKLRAQVLLLRLNSRLQDEAYRAAGGARPGGGASDHRAGPKPEQDQQQRFSNLLNRSEADTECAHGKLWQRQRRCICSRP
ncbi:uncharacterized protein C20orf144 [Cavia porcellus]|uniref:uncharacterized protein C20orf144 n=1 Tax=Cavia porcellus TaxID=10141 RepID=UPI00022B767A|nr:uncharacterized protein C20orf144 homolog [Cavia porcellus]